MSVKFENDVDRYSYALAMNIFSSLDELPIDLNKAIVSNAIAELLKGGKPALTVEEYKKAMRNFQVKMQAEEKARASEASKKNLDAEKEFLEANGKRDGVITTASGLQYEVLTEGKGAVPGPANVVKVHYEGKLLDGTIFDSSMKRGIPAEFPVNQVIAGWTEALQLMRVGGRNRLYIPSALAYGSRGAGDVIGPDATLIFDVELIDIVK